MDAGDFLIFPKPTQTSFKFRCDNDSNTVKGIAKEFFLLVIGIEVNIGVLEGTLSADRMEGDHEFEWMVTDNAGDSCMGSIYKLENITVYHEHSQCVDH